MVSMASLESFQADSWVRLLHATGVGVGLGLGVGVGVVLGVGEGVFEGGLKGAGDGLMLRIGAAGRAPSSTAVIEPVPMSTTSTTTEALGLGNTPAQRVM
ncbi:MAG TPA: hypothetical protein VLS53_03870 [Candidatus Dormibacteraeota bacterium]|nr:hypothetical protein [Candidatus Dormibacteraeota bacterium]